ncbi:MAG: acyl-CoA thioesterase [Pseudomonadota bacterium]
MTDATKTGELMVRTAAMPADANSNGDIFGGWVLSQMDIAGGIAAAEYSHGRVATVAIEAMAFLKPVHIGDVLCVYTDVVNVGRTSIRVHIEAWVRRQRISDPEKVTEGDFTFVAIDEQGQKRLATPPETKTSDASK